MDALLAQIAANDGFTYSRYADDMFFSHQDRGVAIGRLLTEAKRVVAAQRFQLNHDKTLIMRSPRRQTVTGLIVNSEPRVTRQDLRRFRAFLHRCETQGLEAVSRELGKDANAYACGYFAYIEMVNPDQAQRVRTKHSWLSAES
jgi:hypothetical protein